MWTAVLKRRTFYGLLLLLVPAYTWSRFFKTWTRLRKSLNGRKLFYHRHNCVVMFDNRRGTTGWPISLSAIDKTLTNINPYEPILYFIRTAEKSLDVAVMVINNSTITNALMEAYKRGVAIRLVLDYAYSRNGRSKDLEKSGVRVLYYVCPSQSPPSIMHHKYMLKDYSSNNGYVYLGSQNWTNLGFEEYYENNVFTTNRTVVDAIHKNFEQTWEYVVDLYKNNTYVKTKLMGAL